MLIPFILESDIKLTFFIPSKMQERILGLICCYRQCFLEQDTDRMDLNSNFSFQNHSLDKRYCIEHSQRLLLRS